MSKRFSISGLGNAFGKALPALLVSVGVFSSVASAAFKPPAGWSSVYFNANNLSKPIPSSSKNANGWWVYDMGESGAEAQETKFALSDGTTTPMKYVTTKTWDALSQYDANVAKNNRDIPCPGASGSVYVAKDPSGSGTYVGDVPPNAKFLYVLVPDDKEWQSDVMMVKSGSGAGAQMALPTCAAGSGFFMRRARSPTTSSSIARTSPKTRLARTVSGEAMRMRSPCP